MQEIDAAVLAIQARSTTRPRVGMILGSGLGALADSVSDAVRVPVHEIPSWPVPTVEGHAGEIVIGTLESQPVIVLQGRAHFYEGHSMSRLGLPVRAMQALGAETLLVTNAAGGVNPHFRPGDLMLITDHLNLIGMAGLNPLRGPHLDEYGPPFPDMSQAYDPALQAVARRVAARLGFTLQEGIYMCLAGPTFETPADIRFLRTIGADAVGMSTVPEVIVARHGGLRVMGVSGISNVAIVDPGEGQKTTHEEVLEAGKLIVPRLVDLVKGVLQELPP